ncbi:MAG: tripartite tricarboxylate transporter substrate binding protein [Xanthobacteraceae bacterium]
MKPILRLLLAAAIGLGLPALSQAQTYPARPIKMIVPSPAGATTDSLVRMVAQKLQAKWGQPVIVDNRPGAGGNIGAEEAAKAAPDGYTLLFTYPAPLAVNKTLFKQLAYDPDSFVPISLVATVPLVLAVPPKEEATSVSALIAFAKAHPNQLNFASQGYGTSAHLAGELFKSMAGIDIVHVPYKGSAPALTDLLGGRIDMMFIELSTVLPQIRAGKLHALAVGSAKRNPFLPDVPALAEVLPGYQASTWFGMVAPPGTPPELAAKLSSAVAAAIHEPDMAQRLVDMSVTAVGDTPAEMADFLRDERQRWGGVIRAAGVKAE